MIIIFLWWHISEIKFTEKYFSKGKNIFVGRNEKIFAIPNIKTNKFGLVSSSSFFDYKIDNIETISGYELYKNNYNEIDIEYLHLEEKRLDL